MVCASCGDRVRQLKRGHCGRCSYLASTGEPRSQMSWLRRRAVRLMRASLRKLEAGVTR